jgi:hypothetical protein
MTHPAMQILTPRAAMTRRSKRVRRFWASMGAALRQSSGRFPLRDEAPGHAIPVRVAVRGWPAR